MNRLKALEFGLIVSLVALLAACGGVTPSSDAPLRAQAATIRVTTTADEFNNDGDCSLREAIAAANHGQQVDDCRGSEADEHTIVLAEKAFYSLGTLHEQSEDNDYIKSALPVFAAAITVEGNGATLYGVGRDLTLLSIGYDGDVTLNHLTIAGGYTTSRNAAAIVNRGKLYGDYLTLAGNNNYSKGFSDAGGIYNTGTLDLSHCTFRGNYAVKGAGAVYSAISSHYQTNDYGYVPESRRPYVHFDQCLFEANSTDTGVAAIYNSGWGRLTLERSSIVKSVIKEYVFSGSQPEAIPAIIKNNSDYVDKITNRKHPALLLENVTLSLSKGPVYSAVANFTTARLMHSTVFKNHSTINANAVRGLYNRYDATFEIGHTVVADHEPRDVQGGSTWGDCYASNIDSLGYNFESDGSCKFSANGDMHEHKRWAMLLPLDDNGGFTPTHALVPVWSKLWNAGDTQESTNHGTDQRGDVRLDGNEVDIGAYEACNDIGIFWLFIIPIPYCLEAGETLSLELPLNEQPLEKRLDAELHELIQAPCDYCNLGIGLMRAGVLRFELDEAALERAHVEAILLYNADGEVVADGERGIEVELEPGRYYLEVVGEGNGEERLPATATLSPL